jgi:hypothetical protein
MTYIQLDNFNGNLSIVCKDDGSGEPLIFDNLKKAQNSLEENCQNGQVIPLEIDMIYLIKELSEAAKSGGTTVHIDDLVADVLNHP